MMSDYGIKDVYGCVLIMAAIMLITCVIVLSCVCDYVNNNVYDCVDNVCDYFMYG